MQRRRLGQPYMAVDARTLVKPALLERGIRTDADKILFSVIQVFRNVVYLRAGLPVVPPGALPGI